MIFDEKHPFFIAAVIFGGFFCIFTIVSFFPAVFPYLDQSWWVNFSTVTDIFGMFGYLMVFVYLITRTSDVLTTEEVERLLDEYEERKQEKLEDAEQPVELPEGIDYTETIEKLDVTINTLRSSSLSSNTPEFESIKTLLSIGQTTDAVIRSRRAIEVLFRDMLIQKGVALERRRTSARRLIDKAVRLRIISTRQKSDIVDFLAVANGVVHGQWNAQDLHLDGLFSEIIGIIDIIVRRNDGQIE